ncbi:MAG: hypothetical protein HN342_13510 [Nitrospina sp.]|jgi:hypothetical protein|nr:hypothetical protein [Nitrospina sp.]
MHTKELSRTSAILHAVESELGSKQETFKFDNDRYTIRVANDLNTRRQAYELIYDLYIEKGFAKPDMSEMWFSIHDALPNTVTFVVENQSGDMVGTATVILDTGMRLPIDTIYPEEIKALRSKGRCPSEVAHFGVRDNLKGGMQVLVKLFNFFYIYAHRICKSTDFVITVNPRHASFYKKALLFNQVGEERDYGKVNGAPAVLMHLDLSVPAQQIRLEHEQGKRTGTIYKYFYSTSEEPEIAQKLIKTIRPMTEKEFRYFFVEQTNLFMRASTRQRHYLEKCYLTHDMVEVA